MAIKKQAALTKEDFEEALITLRLSVSEVSRESGIPRHIVSHFRNYGDGLKPEQAAKLQDFFESKGIEFGEEEATASHQQKSSRQQTINLPLILSDDGLTQRTVLVLRHFFIDERLTDAQIKDAGQRFEDGFNQAKGLLDVELGRTWLSDDFDEETESKMRELWGHLARIGLLSLHLQGRILIDHGRILANSLAEGDKPKPVTFGDLLSDTYSDAVAGLNAADKMEEGTDDEGDAS